MAEDENKEEIDREQKLANKRIARAKLQSRLILGVFWQRHLYSLGPVWLWHWVFSAS